MRRIGHIAVAGLLAMSLLLLAPAAQAGDPVGSQSVQSGESSLAYGSFFGGSNHDFGRSLAVHSSGIYVLTFSYGDPPTATPGASDTTWEGGDAIVTKFSPDGTSRLWTTYVGGSGSECHQACSMAVDDGGAVYVTGSTDSADFPTTPGAFDSTFNGDQPNFTDVFVAKVSADGSSLEYGTYLGGGYFDAGNAIEVDATGAAFVTGTTSSVNFPTTPGAFATTCADCSSENIRGDAFVTKINPSGTELVYSTFLGGTSNYTEGGAKIRVDSAGAAYVLGGTRAPDFPTTSGAFETTFNEVSYARDAFVTKLAANGGSLEYSTYLGGGFHDDARDLRVDATGAVVVVGGTRSSDFPTTAGAFDTECNSCSYGAAFVTKLNPTGTGQVYGTYLEGDRADAAHSLAIDADGSAVVAGETISIDFPTTPNAFDRTLNNGSVRRNDAFVTKLNPSGDGLAYSSFLGGTGEYWVCNSCGDDTAATIALDADGTAVVTGSTSAFDFPTTTDAFDSTFNDEVRASYSDAFIAKIVVNAPPVPPSADLSAFMTDAPDPVTVGSTLTYTVQVTNAGPDPATDAVVTDPLPAEVTLVSADSTTGTCEGTDTVRCELGTLQPRQEATITIRVIPDIAATITNAAEVAAATADPDGSDNAATTTTTAEVDGPPNTTITSGPSEETTSSAASFTFWSSKASSTFECSLDESTFTACTSPASYEDVAVGVHTFRVRAIDSDGNIDPSPAERTWTIVSPNPADEIDVSRADYWRSSSRLRVAATSTNADATLTVHVTATDELIGTLTNAGEGDYDGTFTWPDFPGEITVRSSLGGAQSATVVLRN